jgi:hypothetical protein
MASLVADVHTLSRDCPQLPSHRPPPPRPPPPPPDPGAPPPPPTPPTPFRRVRARPSRVRGVNGGVRVNGPDSSLSLLGMSNGTSPSRLALGSQMHAARPQDATADTWYAVAKQMLDDTSTQNRKVHWIQQPSLHASLPPSLHASLPPSWHGPWGKGHNLDYNLDYNLGYNMGGHPAGAHLGGYLGHNLGYNFPPHLAAPGALPDWGGPSHLPILGAPPEGPPPPRPPFTPPPRRPPRREGEDRAPTLHISWSTGRLPGRGDTSRLVF